MTQYNSSSSDEIQTLFCNDTLIKPSQFLKYETDVFYGKSEKEYRCLKRPNTARKFELSKISVLSSYNLIIQPLTRLYKSEFQTIS